MAVVPGGGCIEGGLSIYLENFATLYFVSADLVSSSDLEVFSEAWTE